MKKSILIFCGFLFTIFIGYAVNENYTIYYPQEECPKEGRERLGKSPLTTEEKNFNRKKNMSAAEPNENPDIVPFSKLLNGLNIVDDRDDWNEGAYVEIMDAYLIDYKQQGGESCNCYYADKDNNHKKEWGDIHINIGTKDIMKKKNNNYYMIVEITPSYKKLHPDYLSTLKSLKGKKVTIRGYLFYDTEHERNSVNYCKSCTNTGVWRKSCWEIHPVTYIGSSQ